MRQIIPKMYLLHKWISLWKLYQGPLANVSLYTVSDHPNIAMAVFAHSVIIMIVTDFGQIVIRMKKKLPIQS